MEIGKKTLYVVLLTIVTCLLIANYFKEASFISGSEKITATVQQITKYASKCRILGTRNSKRKCTRFVATVDFVTKNNELRTLEINAGDDNSIDSPIGLADYKIDERILILYNNKYPKRTMTENDVKHHSIWPIIIIGLIEVTIFIIRA